MKLLILLIIVIGSGVLAGCSDKKETSHATKSALPVPVRTYNLAQITKGGRLFRQHCAACHGTNAEGAQNWRQRNPDGKYPAPPLDGSGHAWHHPMNVLQMTIREGTQKIGGSMPAWGNKLSADEIDAIIAWFQAKWPEEIYREWSKHNQIRN